jgi:serine protease Do
MGNRSRTIASFFTVAMAAMLLGAVVTQVQRSGRAVAYEAPSAPATDQSRELGQGGAPLTLTTFRDIAKRVSPGVVNITSKKEVRVGRYHDLRDFFGDDMMDRFFGKPQQEQRQPQKEVQRDLGSGFIIDRAGYILTNRHVIDDADSIRVNLADGKQYEAKLVGKDARTDVALLKIETTEPLTVLELGDSDSEDLGEWVMAIGNPFGLTGTVTVGVVSFKGRPLTLGAQGTSVEMIQTDASINPGNSGGPLINTKGQVIGINTLIITQGAMQSAGVGFAVPINSAKEILTQLREHGKVVRGWLGIKIQVITEDLAKSLHLPDTKGAYVSDVTAGSPAEKAGVKAEDVVVGVDAVKVETREALTSYVASKAPGTTVKLQVLRGGSLTTVPVTLGTFPEEIENGGEESQPEQKAALGMSLRTLTPDIAERLDVPRGTRGVVVTEVEGGSTAEEAGLQRGDVIVTANGKAVESVEQFEAEIAKAKAEGLVRLRVRRGNTGFFTVVLKLQ